MNKTVLIPVMFRPYEDELLESWLVRLARANGMPVHFFRRTYLMDEIDIRHRTQSSLPYYLDGLFWKSKSVIGFPDADELLLCHTLIPFFKVVGEPVMTLARKAQAVLYNCGIDGYDVDYSHEPPSRRICPKCLNEAASKGLVPYLKVWHQVPGVKTCAIHKCRLLTVKNYDMAALSNEDTDEFTETDIAFAARIYTLYLRIKSKEDFKPVSAESINGLHPQKSDKVFLYAYCTTCGTRFLTTIYAVSKGRFCPFCDRKEDVINRQLKMIPGYIPVRKIKSLGDTGAVRHCCGQILAWRAGDIIWNGRRCGCGTNLL